MKTWKKVLALVLAVSMVIPGVYLGGSGSKEVQAAEGESTVTEKDYTETWSKEQAITYLNVKKTDRDVPAGRDGYLFAGLFNREECTLDDGIANANDIKGETVWLKFVPAGILNVKAQSTPSTENGGDVMRFVSSVDTLNYSKVGFEVTYESGEGSVTKSNISNTVFKRIDSTNENINYEFSPKVVDVESDYFITATLDINSAPFDKNVGTDYTVKAFWETFDGVRVRGASRCVSVKDCRATDTVNLTFTATGITTDTKLSVKECSTDNVILGEVTVVAVDGNTVHVRITLKNKTANDQTSSKAKLPSATKFTFMVTPEEGVEAGPAVGSAIFRNLYTKYTGTGTDDITWYDVYGEDEKEYVIATSADLYGLAQLTNAGNEFYQKTVYLISDIEVNTGSAANWASAAPAYPWIPIGTQTNGTNAVLRPFTGTFDGQKHTISGLYYKGTATSGLYMVGLFGRTNGTAVIKSVSLKNSYFAHAGSGDTTRIGSFVGRGGGTLDSLYSDAILSSVGLGTGGMIGEVNTNAMITNCWFKGSVTGTANGNAYAGGIAGYSAGTLDIYHCLNSGTVHSNRTTNTGPRIGGVIGSVTGGQTTINDCLNVGDVTSAGATLRVSDFVGFQDGTGTAVTIQNSFTTNNSCAYALYEGAAITSKGNVWEVEGTSLIGIGGYQQTRLDFDNHWAAVEGKTPQLQVFTDKDDMLDVSGENRVVGDPDTTWLNDATGDDEEHPYVIADAADLYGLANLVNDRNSFKDKYFIVENDIVVNTGKASDWEKAAPLNEWIPIGKQTGNNATDIIPFEGTFDGQGKTISGLYHKSTATSGLVMLGLFGRTTENATIKNLSVKNSYFAYLTGSDRTRIGSFVGRGGGTFENLCSDSTLANIGLGTGGILGEVAAVTTIEDCWFDGSITGTANDNAYAGGIVGIGNGKCDIRHCLNSGSVHSNKKSGTGSRVAGILGAINGGAGDVTIEDCLNVGDITSSGATNRVCDFVGYQDSTAKIAIQNCFTAAGSCAYKLYEGTNITDKGNVREVSDGYLLGIEGYQYTSLDFDKHWAAVEEETPQLQVFTDEEKMLSTEGLERAVVIEADTSWVDETAGTKEKPYLIKDAADLYGLAKLVNEEKNTFNGRFIRLSDDIKVNIGNATDWNEKTPLNLWTPIGIYNGVAFEGNFDGDGHTISGVCAKLPSTTSVALFGATTTDTTIGNFRVVNSYFEGKNGVGTVGGWITNVKKVYSIYTDAIVHSMDKGSGDNPNTGYAGGILGLITGTGTIENCWNAGSIDAVARYVGGITGYTGAAGVVINNCLNTGALSAGQSPCEGDAGGLVGMCVKGITIKNSLHVGTANTYHQGGVMAHINGGESPENFTIENVYYIEKANRSAIGYYNVTGAKYDQPIDGATAVSAADLASKGVAGLQDTDAWHWEAGYKYPVLSIFKDIMKK